MPINFSITSLYVTPIIHEHKNLESLMLCFPFNLLENKI